MGKKRKYNAYEPLSKEKVRVNFQEKRPVMPLDLKISTSIHDGRIVMEEEGGIAGMVNQTIRREMDTREKIVRDSLIKLGWTPPDDSLESVLNGQLAEVRKNLNDAGVADDQITERTYGNEGFASWKADVGVVPLNGIVDGIDTESMQILNRSLLSKALRAICFMRDYCPSQMPALPGWDWFDVGSEIAKAIPGDEWAREFRSRVEIDKQHREICMQLREWLIDNAPLYSEDCHCHTPMFTVVPSFLDREGFDRNEQDVLLSCNVVRLSDGPILCDAELNKMFEEVEL